MNGNEIIKMLSENISPIASAVSSVTGAVFTAIFLRHNTSAKEFEKIKVGQFKEVADSLLESGKMTYLEYYKAKNYLKIAKLADEYYSEIKQDHVESDEYDFDWFIRFYEAAGNVADEQMQMIWAKILAGEISQPSSFSLKTIDVLRNIRKNDAELFMNVYRNSFSSNKGFFLPHNEEYLSKCEIKFKDIMKLDELGLVNHNAMISLLLKLDEKPTIFVSNSELMMTISSMDGKEIQASIPQYPFTEAGNEIASLSNYETLSEKIVEYGRIIAENYKKYNVAVYRIIRRDGDIIEYDNKKNLIEVEE